MITNFKNIFLAQHNAYNDNNSPFRFVEWVKAPKLAVCLDTPVRGTKLTDINSSKFCTGRHLQYYNETIQILQERKRDVSEDHGSGSRYENFLDQDSGTRVQQ